jgi:hypothetical protein
MGLWAGQANELLRAATAEQVAVELATEARAALSGASHQLKCAPEPPAVSLPTTTPSISDGSLTVSSSSISYGTALLRHPT